MRICVLGKRGSVIGWVEAAVAAWRASGHAVLHAVFRDSRLNPSLERLLYAQRFGAPRATALVRHIKAFAPDLIVAIDAFSTPPTLLARLRAVPDLPPLLGWVGDGFGDYARRIAPYFDAICYTDSGLISLHTDFGLPCAAHYLPHAANMLLQAAVPAKACRHELVFVANPTAHRQATLVQLREPVVVHGPGWHLMAGTVHEVHARRVATGLLGEIYRAHAAVLNIRNETHVLAGLNQRNFDPFLCGAAVLTDPQPDLERCFDPDREVLVWRDPAEIDEVSARLRREPTWAARVATNGLRRVRDEHTYAARLSSLARLSGVRASPTFARRPLAHARR
jgi:spore maturation protein CgeB